MKIVVDDKIPFIRGVFEPYAEVVYLPGAAIGAADVRDADAIVTRTRTRCGRALLEGSSVRAIASATIGYDHIDTSYCESRGIAWSNAPGCNAGSVAQWVSSVLETLARSHGFNLAGRTLGIVGVGHVGSKVQAAASALGMKVMLCDPPRALAEGPSGFVSFEDIIEGADIVTLHVPLTAETFHMVNASVLGRMKPSQILINSSRGEVVDSAALKACLEAGGLMAAALDVWENEPDVDPALVGLAEIATPHIAGYSLDGKANGTSAAVRFIARQLGISELIDFSVVLPPATDASYDVTRDSNALKADLTAFEHLRETYPVRREL